ncbi:TraB/GumN family protein [Lacimicrobium alkaliphilum]|uniref:Polysaccharide biosynthesis protein GumN n=1 Tax=Lacimicrobium alkaliphilum TaxID=1526571 RepID=A0A0U2Z615_9ALTE|nr:TraB/GumN family protein [Lacimicrobium alkaliphilum]ALS97908.1 hypothetical protein AT746_06260 [Lacimicrobium alkaliphilum]
MKVFFSACLLFLSVGVAQAASVWEVTSKDDNVLYLGGTLHLLTAEDYPLDSAYKSAYRLSDRLIFETDQAVLETPQFKQALMQRFALAEGEELSDFLAPQTYDDLRTALKKRGIAVESMQGFKASMVALTLTMSEFHRLGFTQPGVDKYFYNLALEDGKSTGQLETPAQQLDFLTSMGHDNPEQLIRYTLKDIDQMPEMIGPLRQAWLDGDLRQLDKLGLKPMQQEYPRVYEVLIKERNRQWMKQLIPMFASKQTHFVLVGALHLTGEDGLLIQLRQQGFKLKQL